MTEAQIEASANEWLRLQYAHVHKCLIKIMNEGKRSVAGHIQAKKQGLHKGASDLFIAYPSKNYHGLFIEIKKDGYVPSGKVQLKHYQNQIDFIKHMRSQGYAAEMCVGLDEIIAVINDYLK